MSDILGKGSYPVSFVVAWSHSGLCPSQDKLGLLARYSTHVLSLTLDRALSRRLN